MSDVTRNTVAWRIIQEGMALNIKGGKITATTTAAKIPETPLANRKSIMIRNESGQDAYVGASNVTTGGANGMIFKNGEIMSIDMDDDVDIYVVLASGTGTIYYLEGA